MRRRASWRERTYVVLDFETTSANPRHAQPLSVGWVRVREGRVRCGEAGYTLLRHVEHVPAASIRIHGLLPEDLAAGADPAAVAATLREELGRDGVLVAHGAGLERTVLRRLGVRPAAVVDTLRVVRRLDERHSRSGADPRLPAAAERWAVPVLRSHHAFGDALTTALLLVTLAGAVEQQRGRCEARDLELLSR